MPTIPNMPLEDADETVLQPSADPEKTQLLTGGQESTRLMGESSGNDLHRRPSVDVNSVLLGRFKLAQLVGEGGMSDVYKAIDLRKVEAGARDPHLAVKVLTVGFDDFFSSLAVMHHEASKLQTLTHPNIVRVFDCDRDGQTVFMTMEYLDGTPLKFIIKKGGEQGPPREEADRIIAGMVAALEFAHAKHIVHGDLKPGNVIVTKGGEVKVIDFGIARFLRRPHDDGPHEELPTDYVAFTPLYTSPETYDRAEPDARDDVYSLACITHELLTGTHPFNRRPSSEAREQKLQVARSPRLRAHEHRAIQSALNFDRGKRTPSARQFLAELTGTRQRSVRQIVGITAIAIAALVGMLFLGRLLVKPATTDLTAGTVFRDCATCPLMVVLKPGRFEQGSAASETNATPFERPVHSVQIAYPLAAGISEVTVGEYAEFAKESPRVAEGCMTYGGEWALRASVDWRNAVPGQMGTHPVTCVSHRDATEYTAWLSRRTGSHYRLPSASEWEYMARAGSTTLPWSDPAQACANANVADQTAAQRFPGWATFSCADNFVQSAPVGSFAPNAFGLSDTLGNVFEWVQDCWRDDYNGAPADGSAVSNGDCTQREARGGSWFTTPAFVRPAYRNRFEADYHGNSLGFRVVREIRNEK
jgi:formylglycine-generating enzyme required for sulfatase activity/predicted Ser/Thr protein kinase